MSTGNYEIKWNMYSWSGKRMIAIKKKQELNNLLTKGLFINNSEMEIEKYQNEPKREIVVLSKKFSS